MGGKNPSPTKKRTTLILSRTERMCVSLPRKMMMMTEHILERRFSCTLATTPVCTVSVLMTT